MAGGILRGATLEQGDRVTGRQLRCQRVNALHEFVRSAVIERLPEVPRSFVAQAASALVIGKSVRRSREREVLALGCGAASIAADRLTLQLSRRILMFARGAEEKQHVKMTDGVTLAGCLSLGQRKRFPPVYLEFSYA